MSLTSHRAVDCALLAPDVRLEPNHAEPILYASLMPIDRPGEVHFFPLEALGGRMFLVIGLILLALWALGFWVFPVVGSLVHILLVLAIISILWQIITGRGNRA
jgi:hypothetical protein